MKNCILNNLSWIFPSIATLLAAILTIVFSKQIKEKVKSWQKGNISLKNSHNNHIQNQTITNHYGNELKSDYKSEQTIIAHHRIFELTDGLIKLAIVAFRPVKFKDPKSFADHLNEIIDRYNEYVVYFDSKEILFDQDIVILVHEIRDIVLKCIQHQKAIEDFKSMRMPWEFITPKIKSLREIYYEQVEKELPKLRERMKEIIRKK